MSSDFFVKILMVLGAGAGAYLAYIFGVKLSQTWLAQSTSRRVKDMLGVKEAKKSSPAQYGSREFRIRLAFSAMHIDVANREELAVNIARFTVGLLVSLTLMLIFGLPPMASASGMLGGVLIANMIVGGAWRTMCEKIDQEIPVFLSGFSSTIQVNPNILQSMEEESGVLASGSPLQKWLRERFVRLGQEKGVSALPELIDEAFVISNSLGIMIFLIGRLWRTGGMEWRRSFALAASNLEGVMEARILGLAAGSSAKGAVKVIIGVTLVVVMILARNPLFMKTVNSPVVQLVYAGTTLSMIFGYGYIGTMIDNLL